MSRRLGAKSALLLSPVLFLLLGCTDSVGTALSRADLRLTVQNQGTTVSATVGQRIELTLQTLGEGEYGTPTVSSTAVTFLGETISPEPDPGGSQQVFRFEAVASGSATITAEHTGTDPNFSVTVEVS